MGKSEADGGASDELGEVEEPPRPLVVRVLWGAVRLGGYGVAGLLGVSLLLAVFGGGLGPGVFDPARAHYAPVLEGLERYREARGSYPERLVDLVPEFLPAPDLGRLSEIGHGHEYRIDPDRGAFTIHMDKDVGAMFPVLMSYRSQDKRWRYDGN